MDKEALDFLGVTRFHEAGYTGFGMKVMSDEKVTKKEHADVISPKGWKSKRGHGDIVMDSLKLVVPDATLIAYPFNDKACADYIIEQGVCVFTTSLLSSTLSKKKAELMERCISNGCIFFAAAGNNGKISKGEDSAILGESKDERYLAIGGVRPRYRNGEYDWSDLYKVNYSSEGKELDYVTIAEVVGSVGTSFCVPIFAGMVALAQELFLKKAGRMLTREEMIRFIDDNVLDLYEEGHDIKTGKGLFILPDPDKIVVEKYVEVVEKMDLVKTQVVFPDGIERSMDAIVYNDRNYIGVRDIFTEMGYKVTYENGKVYVRQSVPVYEYSKKKGCHIIKVHPENFKIVHAGVAKTQVGEQNYFNLDYFGGNPMYSVCNVAIAGNIVSHTKSLQGASTSGKAQTTLYTTKDGLCGFVKTDDLTTIPNLNYAIGGVPFLLNGEEVSLSRDIKTEGWSGGNFYQTWHTFLTIQDGFIWIIGAYTGNSNDVRATTVIANTLKGLGCTGDVIKMDGGGSFVFAKEGKIVEATKEDRKINYIVTYA